VLSVVGLLAAPAGWSLASVVDGNGSAWLPQAGPATAVAFGGPGGPNGFAGQRFPGAGGGPPAGQFRPRPGGAIGGGPGSGFGGGGGFRGGGGGGFAAITFAGPDLPPIGAGLLSDL